MSAPAQRRLPLYLDHHATTPVDPRVLAAMLPYFSDQFGNAASIDHPYGHAAEQAVEKARDAIAKLIGGRSSDIAFTSGATEANNLALFGLMGSAGGHLIVARTEHKAVLDPTVRLEQLGINVTYLDVDSDGRVDPDDVRRAIRPETVLVSVMAANNEIGTLQPIPAIGQITAEHDIWFHTDATQAIGHVPIDVESSHVDLLSLSAHKFYGPKGIGALYVRRRGRRVKLTPAIWGGGHERGLRSGTLNVPGIVGLGAAASLASQVMVTEGPRVRALASRLLHRLRAQAGEIELNGHATERLPHNLNLYIRDVKAKSLIMRLPELAFSTGAACSTAHVEPSHVLEALGLGEERAFGSIRLGLGRSTTEADADFAADHLAAAIVAVRQFVGNDHSLAQAGTVPSPREPGMRNASQS